MSEVHAIILAAGKGTRMKSELAKVLHPLAGRPLLAHVLDALSPLGPRRTVVVVGHQAERVAEVCRGPGVETVLQEEQLGTGHAVDQARSVLADASGHTLVLCGDVPLLSTQTLRRLLDQTRDSGAAAGVLTAIAADATGYGRIVRDDEGRVAAIVEEKDADDSQRAIREYNTGTWCFPTAELWPALERLDRDNAQGEYYLTDVVEIFVADGKRVEAVVCDDEREVQGINTLTDLRRAEEDYAALRGEGSL